MAGAIDVIVTRASLEDFSDLAPFRDVLSGDERSRADAYKLAEPGAVFTLARGALRLELSKRLGVSPRSLEFDVRPSGKPDLRRTDTTRPDWRFSVSHTGPHMAIAMTLGLDLGIDIEPVDRAVNPLDIAKRYFAPREIRALETLPLEDRRHAFFAGWTRKEAIVKARGVTMAESLTTLSVDLDPEAVNPLSEDDASTPSRAICTLTSFHDTERRLIGAVAVQSDRPARLSFEVLSARSFD